MGDRAAGPKIRAQHDACAHRSNRECNDAGDNQFHSALTPRAKLRRRYHDLAAAQQGNPFVELRESRAESGKLTPATSTRREWKAMERSRETWNAKWKRSGKSSALRQRKANPTWVLKLRAAQVGPGRGRLGFARLPRRSRRDRRG